MRGCCTLKTLPFRKFYFTHVFTTLLGRGLIDIDGKFQ
jgi:hypothetical protein